MSLNQSLPSSLDQNGCLELAFEKEVDLLKQTACFPEFVWF